MKNIKYKKKERKEVKEVKRVGRNSNLSQFISLCKDSSILQVFADEIKLRVATSRP